MIDKKVIHLKQILGEMNSVLVAFSGGIDSTFLLRLALEVLGSVRVVAVTTHSEVNSAKDLNAAKSAASSLGARHFIISTEELQNSDFASNPANRCYFCKSELYGKLVNLAEELNLLQIIDGSNFDDQSDFRPGFQATREFSVRSPLLEAGLTKSEIRKMSQKLGLSNWNQPSNPCLCSRIPYGQAITLEKLRQIELAEEKLHAFGFPECRVRHCGAAARIEVPLLDLPVICSSPVREEILACLRSIGFTYVSLDLAGFRSGSMNDVLSKEMSHG